MSCQGQLDRCPCGREDEKGPQQQVAHDRRDGACLVDVSQDAVAPRHDVGERKSRRHVESSSPIRTQVATKPRRARSSVTASSTRPANRSSSEPGGKGWMAGVSSRCMRRSTSRRRAGVNHAKSRARRRCATTERQRRGASPVISTEVRAAACPRRRPSRSARPTRHSGTAPSRDHRRSRRSDPPVHRERADLPSVARERVRHGG
jgi:hypothetical protein